MIRERAVRFVPNLELLKPLDNLTKNHLVVAGELTICIVLEQAPGGLRHKRPPVVLNRNRACCPIMPNLFRVEREPTFFIRVVRMTRNIE